MAKGSGSRVLVTGGSGFIGRRVVPVPQGEMPAVVVDISAARALGYQPTFDLDTGLATVWPEFDPDRAMEA